MKKPVFSLYGSFLKPLFKFFLRQRWVGSLLCYLTAFYIWLVYYTTKWDTEGLSYVTELVDTKTPFIVVFWHNRLLMTSYAWQNWHPFHMLISNHRDGQLIAQAVGLLNIKTIKGSKHKKGKKNDKGGTSALRTICHCLKKGESVGVTPDGPRGPVFQVSRGIGAMARLGKAKVIPLAYGVKRYKTLNTWDRFILPSPFNRGKFVWGKPLSLSKEQDMPSFLAQIETSIKEVTARADNWKDPIKCQ